jgi:hypothetical protein
LRARIEDKPVDGEPRVGADGQRTAVEEDQMGAVVALVVISSLACTSTPMRRMRSFSFGGLPSGWPSAADVTPTPAKAGRRQWLHSCPLPSHSLADG